jgi:hypothetical protein
MAFAPMEDLLIFTVMKEKLMIPNRLPSSTPVPVLEPEKDRVERCVGPATLIDST